MDVYASEKEQIELLKQLWRDYGRPLVIGVVIASLAAFAWRYWQTRQAVTNEQASLIYQHLSLAVNDKNYPAVSAYAQQLKQEYANTTYATIAALTAAHALVDEKKYDLAQQQLQWVMQHAKRATFRQLARINAARIALQLKQLQYAFDLLQTVDDKSFTPLIAEVEGDIYRAQGKAQLAREAYSHAIQQAPSQNKGAPDTIQNLLHMKMNSLTLANNSA